MSPTYSRRHVLWPLPWPWLRFPIACVFSCSPQTLFLLVPTFPSWALLESWEGKMASSHPGSPCPRVRFSQGADLNWQFPEGGILQVKLSRWKDEVAHGHDECWVRLWCSSRSNCLSIKKIGALSNLRRCWGAGGKINPKSWPWCGGCAPAAARLRRSPSRQGWVGKVPLRELLPECLRITPKQSHSAFCSQTPLWFKHEVSMHSQKKPQKTNLWLSVQKSEFLILLLVVKLEKKKKKHKYLTSAQPETDFLWGRVVSFSAKLKTSDFQDSQKFGFFFPPSPSSPHSPNKSCPLIFRAV